MTDRTGIVKIFPNGNQIFTRAMTLNDQLFSNRLYIFFEDPSKNYI